MNGKYLCTDNYFTGKRYCLMFFIIVQLGLHFQKQSCLYSSDIGGAANHKKYKMFQYIHPNLSVSLHSSFKSVNRMKKTDFDQLALLIRGVMCPVYDSENVFSI